MHQPSTEGQAYAGISFFFKDYSMWTIFEDFIEFVTTILLFYGLFVCF